MQLRRSAANAGGAGNDGHAVGVFQLVHGLFEFSTVIAFDATAHTATTWVVGHQHHIAASQRDEGGEGCALVATFFFFNLNQQLLAFADHVLDARLTDRDALGEILFGNFFEWQEAVAVFAVIHEASFERRLDACHDGFVDVAFALFAPFNLDFVIEQFLSIDDGQATLFSLGCIDQHPFHDAFLHVVKSSQAHDGPTMPEQTSENEGNCR